MRSLTLRALRLFGRLPLDPPLQCDGCNRTKKYGSHLEIGRLARGKFVRCSHCYQRMHPPHPGDSGHIRRAATYYGTGEQP